MNRFPDCYLSYVEQRTEGWFALRNGVLTASRMGPWLVNEDKRSRDAMQKAVCEVIAQQAGCDEPPVFETWAMKRGTELEPDAIEYFHESTGLHVEIVGFCIHKSLVAGCSPDGLIEGQNAGLEIKCPYPATHVQYLLDGGLPNDYLCQVHGSMAVSGAESWWFMSYCPRLPTLRLLVVRDEFTEKMAAGIERFAMELEAAKRKLANI